MTLLAGDISSHNPVTSWPAFLGSIDVLIVKISEGTGYVWPGAPVALAQARAAGKCVGGYHFYGGGDPVAEADYFLAHYPWRPGEVPILDWEPTAPPADPDGTAAAFCQRVHDRLGVAPLVYMNSSTARSITWTRTRALGERLWVAQYGANNGQPGTPPAVGAWGSWAEWQYTSNGTRPGVTGPIDLSLFTGTADQWRAYGTPNGASMPLTPADVALILTTDIPRQGASQSGATSLGAVAAWSDSHISELLTQVGALTAAVTQLAHAVTATPAGQSAMTCQGSPHAVLAALGQAANAAASST